MVHTGQSFFCSTVLKNIYDTGDTGVQLFFILSAITLFNSFGNRYKTDGTQRNLFFFIRRFFRISLLYYFFIIFYTVFEIVNHGILSVPYWTVFTSAIFFNGFLYLPSNINIPPGGWSIGVEMVFYLFIPILFDKIKSVKDSFLLLLLAIFISNSVRIIARLIIESFTNFDYKLLSDTTFYFWLPNQFPVFCFGVLLFNYMKKNEISYIVKRISLVASIVLFLFFSQVEFSREYPFRFFQREYVFSLVFCLFIIGIQDLRFNNFIGNIFLKIGRYSFSMYLSHFFVLRIFSYISIHYFGFNVDDKFFIMAYIIVVCLTYFWSSFLFKIEMIGINYGNGIIKKIRIKSKLTQINNVAKCNN